MSQGGKRGKEPRQWQGNGVGVWLGQITVPRHTWARGNGNKARQSNGKQVGELNARARSTKVQSKQTAPQMESHKVQSVQINWAAKGGVKRQGNQGCGNGGGKSHPHMHAGSVCSMALLLPKSTKKKERKMGKRRKMKKVE